jgi:putative tryptophan/tyrosine transport system substrate-binding protein
MRRRALFLLGALAILFLAAPPAFTQSVDKVYRLGILSPSSGVIERMRATMFPELARLGFTEGRNLVVETRLGPLEELPALARDLATVRPDAVVAVGPAIRAMRDAAPATPIVGGFIGQDPIVAGFAASLAHPGGTITGIVMLAPELDGKRLQLLHDAVPGSRRIAALAVTRRTSSVAAVEGVAKQIGVDLLPFYAATPDDYRAAFAGMREAGADALEITSSPEFHSNASALAALAIETRLPTICEWAQMARSGCLLGYGPDFDELERGVAGYVARIFRGAAPGELPIEGPTHFQFAVNLKTAKALGLTIPQSVLARADEVIE